MKTQTRYLVALGLGFVTYRITVEFLAIAVALLLGLVIAGCAWALTGLGQKPPKEPGPDDGRTPLR